MRKIPKNFLAPGTNTSSDSITGESEEFGSSQIQSSTIQDICQGSNLSPQEFLTALGLGPSSSSSSLISTSESRLTLLSRHGGVESSSSSSQYAMCTSFTRSDGDVSSLTSRPSLPASTVPGPATVPPRQLASRRDTPTISFSVRGKRSGESLSDDSRAALLRRLDSDISAASSRRSGDSWFSTWTSFHRSWFGDESSPIPITCDSLRAVAEIRRISILA